jgi:hypothetical protein
LEAGTVYFLFADMQFSFTLGLFQYLTWTLFLVGRARLSPHTERKARIGFRVVSQSVGKGEGQEGVCVEWGSLLKLEERKLLLGLGPHEDQMAAFSF